MKESFEKLKKYRKCYLICSIGQKYIDMVQSLVFQLNKYSNYPVFLYYDKGQVNFDCECLIKQKIDLPEDFIKYL